MPSNLRASRIPSSQSNRPSNWFLNLVAGATISLVLALVMVVTSVAVAEPPAHIGKDSQKCHPKKGCPVDDGGADGAEVPATDPTPEPEPTPEPTQDPAPEPTQDPSTEPTQDPAPEPTQDPAPSSGTWDDRAVASGSYDNMVEGRLGSDATRTALVYKPRWGRDMWVHLVDHAAGTRSDVRLPDDGRGSWQSLRVTLDGDRLWTLSGIGPVLLREFRFGGTASTPTLTQTSTHTHGDTDSRVGDLTTLASGSVVAVWHQQGFSGPNGHGVALHRNDGDVSVALGITGLTTRASRDVVAQHPGDGSIWILNNADASGAIGRIRLAERASGLAVLSVDYGFIGEQHAGFRPSPEFPGVAVASDPEAGELVLAYQSAVRQRISTGQIWSNPAVARLQADGSTTFQHVPVEAERDSPIGLTVQGSEVWLTHRPLDSSGSFNRLDVAHLDAGRWTTVQLGTLSSGWEAAPVDPRRPVVVYERADSDLRWAAHN